MRDKKPSAPEVLRRREQALDQEPGWLRSRFMRWQWPREGVKACGRKECPVCSPSKRTP